MIADIEAGYRQTAASTGRSAPSPAVVAALRSVPREAFVPPEHAHEAYANRPLPIGHGQTISQPYIVALMIDLLDPDPDDVVLEIGTGCGYAAAVLSRCVRQVYTIETVAPLADAAAARLRHLGLDNISVRHGDGYAGCPEHAPYDGIVVTAAAPSAPQALIDQLAPGGTLVVPVGPAQGEQHLIRIQREPGGRLGQQALLPVAFVPMVPGDDPGPASPPASDLP